MTPDRIQRWKDRINPDRRDGIGVYGIAARARAGPTAQRRLVCERVLGLRCPKGGEESSRRPGLERGEGTTQVRLRPSHAERPSAGRRWAVKLWLWCPPGLSLPVRYHFAPIPTAELGLFRLQKVSLHLLSLLVPFVYHGLPKPSEAVQSPLP